MESEHKNTNWQDIPDEAWEVFLPDDEEPMPEEGDFWFDLLDLENE